MPDIIRFLQMRCIDAENVNLIGIPDELAELPLPGCELTGELKDVVQSHGQPDYVVFGRISQEIPDMALAE